MSKLVLEVPGRRVDGANLPVGGHSVRDNQCLLVDDTREPKGESEPRQLPPDAPASTPLALEWKVGLTAIRRNFKGAHISRTPNVDDLNRNPPRVPVKLKLDATLPLARHPSHGSRDDAGFLVGSDLEPRVLRHVEVSLRGVAPASLGAIGADVCDCDCDLPS